MSGLSDVRAYFRVRMQALSLSEWDSPFEEQVPENIVDRAFQLTLGQVGQIKNNQRDLELTVPANLNVYVKGYRRNAEGYDIAVALTDSIIAEVMNPANRLTQASIKTVSVGSIGLERFGPSNDNVIRIRMAFNVLVIINL